MYTKRKKFHGNRFVTAGKRNSAKKRNCDVDDGPNLETQTANGNQNQDFVTPPRCKRLRIDPEMVGESNNQDYFIMINFEILKEILSSVGKFFRMWRENCYG